MSEAKHTPTPWHVNHDRPEDETSQLSISNGDARIIANVVTRKTTHGWEGGCANASFIVEAVNNYAKIQSELAAAQSRIGDLEALLRSAKTHLKTAWAYSGIDSPVLERYLKQLDAALSSKEPEGERCR